MNNYPDELTVRITEDDKTVYATLDALEPNERVEFEQFLDDVNSVSPISLQTGLGPFPSFQLIQLNNVPAASVLTKFDPDQVFEFEFLVQNSPRSFTALGSDMISYQDVINVINASNSGVTASYISATQTSPHKIIITNNTKATGSDFDQSTGIGTPAVASRLTVTQLLSINVNRTDVETSAGEQAIVDVTLSVYDDSCILTSLAPAVEYDFTVSIAQRPNVVSAFGRDLVTYRDIVDLLNTIDDLTVTFDTQIPRANQLALVGGISPDTIKLEDFSDQPNPQAAFEAAQAALLVENFDNTVVIPDFTLFAAIPVTHNLRLPVHGGQDLVDVIKYSYREDVTLWRDIVPFEWTDYWWGVAPPNS